MVCFDFLRSRRIIFMRIIVPLLTRGAALLLIALGGAVAQTIGVKIKRADFTIVGRQTHLTEPTRDARQIFRAAVHCLRRAGLEGAPVRLLGTRVATLIEGDARQTSLF